MDWTMNSHKSQGASGTAGDVLHGKSEKSWKPQMQNSEGQSRGAMPG